MCGGRGRPDGWGNRTNNTLTVSIYSQANPRMNHALEATLEILKQTETIYPGTNLVVNYKIET